MTGSEVEHAMLLANFFTAMGKKSYLVFGHGIPEGETAYVLTAEENGEYWLWNSVTGEHFTTGATFCSLTKVKAEANESKKD